MASLVHLKSGAYRIAITRGEKQKTIHLGKVNKKTADSILSNIDRIIEANAADIALDEKTARWTANIDDTLYGKIVRVGLLPERQRRTLGTYIDDYIKEHSHWEEGTAKTFNTSKGLMLDFFGKDTPIAKISEDAAVAFRLKLEKTIVRRGNKNEPYKEATIAKIIKHCRQVFNLARKRKLIADNPFETVKTGSQRNPEGRYFVSVEEFQAFDWFLLV